MQFPEANGEEKKQDFMPLSEAAKIAGYTPEHLNLLCRKKLLHAEKLGRNWYTTQEWLDEYFLAKNNVVKSETDGINNSSQIVTNTDCFEQEELQANVNVGEQEDEYQESLILENKNDASRRDAKHLLIVNSMAVVAAFVAIGGIYFSVSQHVKNKQAFNQAQEFTLQVVPDTIAEEGMVKGEETVDEKVLAANAGVLVSENYQIPGVSFGGDVMVVNDDNGGVQLEISDVRSENLTSKDKKENKLLVTWRTSKQAISRVTFSKNNGQEEKTLRENDFGVLHSIVLTGLEPATPYMYQISSRDKWGNETNTDRFGAYIGAQPESVFELIAKNFSEMFGWVKKK